jgi:hypothetical protein
MIAGVGFYHRDGIGKAGYVNTWSGFHIHPPL